MRSRARATSPSGTCGLMVSLLYGPGLRLVEAALRLRVKDLDFESTEILVRGGKGEKDRRTTLPRTLADPSRHQLERVKPLHETDLREGYGAGRSYLTALLYIARVKLAHYGHKKRAALI